jgi:hypothetical protein
MCGGANFACGLYLFALGVNPARPPQKNKSAKKSYGSDIHAGGKGSRCIHLVLSDQLIRALVPKEHFTNVE